MPYLPRREEAGRHDLARLAETKATNASLSALKECTEWHYDKKRAWIRAAERGTVALGFKWFNND